MPLIRVTNPDGSTRLMWVRPTEPGPILNDVRTLPKGTTTGSQPTTQPVIIPGGEVIEIVTPPTPRKTPPPPSRARQKHTNLTAGPIIDDTRIFRKPSKPIRTPFEPVIGPKLSTRIFDIGSAPILPQQDVSHFLTGTSSRRRRRSII